MVELRYARGRLIDSIRFISERNRLAHRYLNFRWQAIRLFAEKKDLIIRIITTLLQEEERKE